MATITEDAVNVTLALERAGGEDRIYVTAQSLASGVPVRSVVRLDATAALSPALTQAMTDLLDAAENRARAYFSIP